MKNKDLTLNDFIGKDGEEKFSSEIKEPFELPEGWRWVKLGEILIDTQSGFACSKKNEIENGIPHLRPNNIGFNGELDFSNLVHLPEEMVDLTKYSLEKGDILFNNTNSKELVGRASLVEEDLSYGFSNHITRLRVNDKLLVPEWLVLAINYLWIQGHFLKICQKWIGQAGVNTKMLKSTQIPLPSIEDQKRIVVRIEGLFSKIEEIKRLRKEALVDAKTLMPSALHEVFSKADEKDWKWVRLGEVLDLSNGKGITKKEMIDEGEYLVYGSNGVIGRANRYLINKDTIVIGRVGASGAINIAKAPAWISDNAMYVSDLSDQLEKMFLYYALVYLELSQLAKIGAQPSVSQEPIKEQEIPLPSLEDQKRIVAYLDKIQEKAIALQKLQKEMGKEIERLRESILHKAFGGEL